MQCQSCGQQVPEDAQYCQHCGKPAKKPELKFPIPERTPEEILRAKNIAVLLFILSLVIAVIWFTYMAGQ